MYKCFGTEGKPTLLLLHGGGLSWWSWQPLIDQINDRYHIITAILNGHGDNYETIFTSIEDQAASIIEHIEDHHDGHIDVIAGLSIGAQITCEILSQKPDICDHAIIESSLLLPLPGIKTWTVPTYKMTYPLVKHRWFAKMQARSLSLPDSMFESYFEDTKKMSIDTLINMTLSNGTYSLKDGLSKRKGKTTIIVGEKELNLMRKSAKLLHEALPGSNLIVAKKMKHGEFSILHPEKFAELL